MSLRQKILLGILAAVVAFYVVSTFILTPKIAAPPPRGVTRQETQGQASGGIQGRIIPGQPQAGQTARDVPAGEIAAALPGSLATALAEEWGPRDPFYRQVMQAREEVREVSKLAEGLVLTGIQWSRGTPVVVINDEILRINDSINGIKIVNVGADYVILQKGADQVTLRLGGNNE